MFKFHQLLHNLLETGFPTKNTKGILLHGLKMSLFNANFKTAANERKMKALTTNSNIYSCLSPEKVWHCKSTFTSMLFLWLHRVGLG